MKKGIKVMFKDKTGISHGLIKKYGTQWVLVEYEDGSKALVKEKYLEVINGRKS